MTNERMEEIARSKLILCLDFDGVIHSYTSGWQGIDVIPDPPVDGALNFMHEALREFDVVIHSSRCELLAGRRAIDEWLRHWSGDLWFDAQGTEHVALGLRHVRIVQDKPPAKVTLDDRALTFTGIFPDVQTLLAFEPWTRKNPQAV